MEIPVLHLYNSKSHKKSIGLLKNSTAMRSWGIRLSSKGKKALEIPSRPTNHQPSAIAARKPVISPENVDYHLWTPIKRAVKRSSRKRTENRRNRRKTKSQRKVKNLRKDEEADPEMRKERENTGSTSLVQILTPLLHPLQAVPLLPLRTPQSATDEPARTRDTPRRKEALPDTPRRR